MAKSSILALGYLIALACCNGTVTPAAASGTTTGSASSSGGTTSSSGGGSGGAAGYLACMSASGQVDASLKACEQDDDCAIEEEQTDCCGTILYVGVRASDVAMFGACETAWVGHFPGCGCASNQTSTEDGKASTFGSDASAPAVHCTDVTANGGVCMTYTP